MAIAFDAATSNTFTTNGSHSHTCTGSNLYLLVVTGVYCTAITYNGVSLTNIHNYTPAFPPGTNCNPLKLWGLVNPATGSNTLSFTVSGGNTHVIAVSYSGVLSDGIEAYTDEDSANNQVSSWSGTVSTVTPNAFRIMFIVGTQSGNFSAGSSTTLRASVTGILDSPKGVLDSGSPINTPGAGTVNASWSGSSFITSITCSLPVTITTMTKSETVPVFDYLAKVPNRFLTETISVIDAMAKVPARLLNEAISLIDTLDNIKGTWYQVAYTETMAITDSVVNSFVFFITAIENLTVTDAVLDFAKKLRGLLRGKNNNTNIKTGVRRT